MMKNTEEKIKRIQALLKKKERINSELEALLNPEKEVVLPLGFSLNSEVLRVVSDAGDTGIDPKNILKALHDRFPKYGIDRKKVASSLAYLKNTKKQLAQAGRGIYKIAGVG